MASDSDIEEITQERLNELKSQIKIEKPLGTLLQDSLEVTRLPRAAGAEECQSFSFDIKVLKVSGKICKLGTFDLEVSVLGIKIAKTTVDLSKGEICWNPKIGSFVSVEYCFSLKDNCLYTRGEISGWFVETVRWNEKLFCF